MNKDKYTFQEALEVIAKHIKDLAKSEEKDKQSKEPAKDK